MTLSSKVILKNKYDDLLSGGIMNAGSYISGWNGQAVKRINRG